MAAPITTPMTEADPYALNHGSSAYRVDRYELDLGRQAGQQQADRQGGPALHRIGGYAADCP